MRRFHALLGIVGVVGFLLSCVPCGAQAPAPFGETQSGAIGAPGESAEWTIAASPGDVILVRATRRSGDLWPRIEVFGESGNPMADVDGIVMAEAIVTVPVGGAGRIRVRDGFDGSHTGAYGLFVQRLNDPLNAVPLSYGLTTDGSIGVTGMMETRTLVADPGDVIVARMTRRGDRLWPRIRIFTPVGGLLADHYAAVTADLPELPAEPVVAPVGGVYTVLLSDGFDGTFTGQFGLFVQRVNRPENAPSLNLAHGYDGAIEAPGVMRTYTVTLPDGYDTPLVVGMLQTGGKTWPLVRLYGPDGALIADEYSFSDTLVSVDVPAGRTYTVLAADGFNGTFAGFYRIGWRYALPDVARALRAAAGFGEIAPEAWDRYNVLRTGDPEAMDIVDVTDAAWIARNASGLQYHP